MSSANSDIGKLEVDVEIKGPAAGFFDVLKHRPHHIANHSPTNIQGCELHEGEWGAVGSIIYYNYFHEGKAKIAKELVEAIDAEKHAIRFKVIEGDVLDHYKSFVLAFHATPKGNGEGGSIVHWVLEYEKHHDDIVDPHTIIDFLVDVTKDIDSHISTTA